MWGNIQGNDDLSLMRFDLSRRSDWMPLFTDKFSSPASSVHGKIYYLPPISVSNLELILDRKLRKKLSKLRQLDRTIWNHNVSNVFKSILHLFENHALQGKNISDIVPKLQDCLTTYQVRVILLYFYLLHSVI